MPILNPLTLQQVAQRAHHAMASLHFEAITYDMEVRDLVQEMAQGRRPLSRNLEMRLRQVTSLLGAQSRAAKTRSLGLARASWQDALTAVLQHGAGALAEAQTSLVVAETEARLSRDQWYHEQRVEGVGEDPYPEDVYHYCCIMLDYLTLVEPCDDFFHGDLDVFFGDIDDMPSPDEYEKRAREARRSPLRCERALFHAIHATRRAVFDNDLDVEDSLSKLEDCIDESVAASQQGYS